MDVGHRSGSGLGSGPINLVGGVIQRLRLEALKVGLFLLSERQMARIAPYFPLAHGVPRVDDRRVVSGIVYVIRNGLQWKDAPRDYGPHKTLYNRFIRWSRMGVFDRIFAALAGEGPKPERIMIDATHLLTCRWNRAASAWSTPPAGSCTRRRSPASPRR